jgi:hypothetical protein
VGRTAIVCVVLTIAVSGMVTAAVTADGPDAQSLTATAVDEQPDVEEPIASQYGRGVVLRLTDDVQPGEKVRVTLENDAGTSQLHTFTADSNAVVRIDTGQFTDIALPATMTIEGRTASDPQYTVRLVQPGITAGFGPDEVRDGEETVLLVRSNLPGTLVRIDARSFGNQNLRNILGKSNLTFRLDEDGNRNIRFDAEAPGPGEYDFVVDSLATTRASRTTLTVLEATPTPTTTPPPTTTTPLPESSEFALLLQPSTASLGESLDLFTQGPPGSTVEFDVNRLTEEQQQEVIRPSQESYELDSGGELDLEFRLDESFFEAGQEVRIRAYNRDLDETLWVRFRILDDGATAVNTTAQQDGSGGGAGESVPTTTTAEPTPARGFFVNGGSDPLGPFANMLNLTVIGFLLSVVGILYQLVEGR